MLEESFGYSLVSIIVTLAMVGGFCLAVYAAGFVAGIMHRLIRDIVMRGRGAGRSLQLGMMLCVGMIAGYFGAEFRGAGSWPQLAVALCVGIVIGRVMQLNVDIAKRIPPLPDRFHNARTTCHDRHPP